MGYRPIAVLVALLLAAACGDSDGGDEPRRAAPRRAITVASFGFSESRTLGEIYAQALEQESFPVRRALGLASREIVEPALEQGVVDLVPEYLGTALAFLENERPGAPTSQAETYARLRRAFRERGVTLGEPAPAENKNGLVVTRATSVRFGLSRTSELAPVASTLVLGGPPECPERPLCLPGLRQVYDLEFREFRGLDAGGPLTVGALQDEEIDVAVLFTSDGHLAGDEFVLLQDDRRLQPSENVVPAVRTAVVRTFGRRLVRTLDDVSARLSTDDLVRLNRRVDILGVDPARAAADWLRGL